MIRRPPRSTPLYSSAASDVYKRQTVLAIRDHTSFAIQIAVWLWLTVIAANLAEAVADGRGKAQAEALRRAKTDTIARRVVDWTPAAAAGQLREEPVPAPQLAQGDVVI